MSMKNRTSADVYLFFCFSNQCGPRPSKFFKIFFKRVPLCKEKYYPPLEYYMIVFCYCKFVVPWKRNKSMGRYADFKISFREEGTFAVHGLVVRRWIGLLQLIKLEAIVLKDIKNRCYCTNSVLTYGNVLSTIKAGVWGANCLLYDYAKRTTSNKINSWRHIKEPKLLHAFYGIAQRSVI